MSSNKILIIIFSMISFMSAQSKPHYDVKKVSDNAYVFTMVWGERSRTNMMVISGEEGFVLLNSMVPDGVDLLETELKKISDKPVKYVINSNWDWHNTGANKYFADKGATIISHENLAYFTNTYTDLLFKDQISLEFSGETITAYRSFGHSMGHVNIHLKKANVVFMSDSYRNQWMTKEGVYGFEGSIRGMRSVFDLSDENTLIVPGNTTTVITNTKNDLLKEINIRKTLVKRFKQLKKEKKSFEEMSKDSEIHALFKKYYDKYTEYSGGMKFIISKLEYYDQMNSHSYQEVYLSKFTGNYSLPKNKIIEVFLEKGELFARSKDMFYTKLVPVGFSKFLFNPDYNNRFIEFNVNSSGEATGLKYIVDKAETRFGQENYLPEMIKLGVIKKQN